LNNTILAIDIGSTKICAIVAEISDSNKVTIIGHGISKSQGIKKGAITNIELASRSIKLAINDAKRIAGSNLTSATVSISNAYAKSLNATGILNLPNRDISIKEINRVMQTALYNANVPNEYEVIHVLPYNFRVDDQDFIEDPFGMDAARLEVDANIIITQKSNLANLKKAVMSAGVEIEGIVLSGYASSLAAVKEDQRDLDLAVIDLGGQTSNLVIRTRNSIRYNDFLGVGSNHITNDISLALHTPLRVAEEVKIKYGNLVEVSDEVIELPIMGDEENHNKVSLKVIHDVMFARVEEALLILAKSIEKSALEKSMSSSLILTGGMSKLKGIRELAEAIFPHSSVWISHPSHIDGLVDELKDPAYSTVVGLVLYKAGKHTAYEIDFQKNLLHSKPYYEENLSNIKIENTLNSIERNVDKQRVTPVQQAVEEKKETISFDDLPSLDPENKGIFKKLANWSKQLF
jgi:cell division protein FtsA